MALVLDGSRKENTVSGDKTDDDMVPGRAWPMAMMRFYLKYEVTGVAMDGRQ